MPSRREFECTDIFGYKVSCSKKRWEHICAHPEMDGLQTTIKSIITRPDFINRSRLFANSLTFYKRCQLGSIDGYIRVVIQYGLDEKKRIYGGVMTAMACNGPQLGEVLLWRGRAII
jgi:hypothetical protein